MGRYCQPPKSLLFPLEGRRDFATHPWSRVGWLKGLSTVRHSLDLFWLDFSTASSVLSWHWCPLWWWFGVVPTGFDIVFRTMCQEDGQEGGAEHGFIMSTDFPPRVVRVPLAMYPSFPCQIFHIAFLPFTSQLESLCQSPTFCFIDCNFPVPSNI